MCVCSICSAFAECVKHCKRDICQITTQNSKKAATKCKLKLQICRPTWRDTKGTKVSYRHQNRLAQRLQAVNKRTLYACLYDASGLPKARLTDSNDFRFQTANNIISYETSNRVCFLSLIPKWNLLALVIKGSHVSSGKQDQTRFFINFSI